jgi:hypothetical protein
MEAVMINFMMISGHSAGVIRESHDNPQLGVSSLAFGLQIQFCSGGQIIL